MKYYLFYEWSDESRKFAGNGGRTAFLGWGGVPLRM